MKKFLKQYGGMLYIALATVAVLAIISSSSELPDALRAFGHMDPFWVWGCVGVMALYLVARCLTLRYYLGRRGYRIGVLDALIITGKGQFYSAVTPSASGGQPAQVVAMHRLGIPLSCATAAVSVKFLAFQIVTLGMGLICWLAHWGWIGEQLTGYRYLVVLGYLVNSTLVVAIGLTMFRFTFIDKALHWCVRMAARLRLVKHEDAARKKAMDTLGEYQRTLRDLLSRPRETLAVLALTVAQILCLMSAPYCLQRAFELTGYGFGQLLTLQLLLFIAASFVPLPGAAGAQEGGFYLFFQGIFPEGQLLAAMLCWRLLTYYLLMLFGLATIVIDVARGWIRRRRSHG